MDSNFEQHAYISQCSVDGKRASYHGFNNAAPRPSRRPWLYNESDYFDNQYKLSRRSTATEDPYSWTPDSEDAIGTIPQTRLTENLVINLWTKELMRIYLALVLLLLTSLLCYFLSALEIICFMLPISSSSIALVLLFENPTWTLSLQHKTFGTVAFGPQFKSLSYLKLSSIDLWYLGCLAVAIAIFPFKTTLKEPELDTVYLFNSRSFGEKVIEQARYWSMWFLLLDRSLLLIIPKLSLPNFDNLRGITAPVRQAISYLRSLPISYFGLPYAICGASSMNSVRDMFTTISIAVCFAIGFVYGWLSAHSTNDLSGFGSGFDASQAYIHLATRSVVMVFCGILDNLILPVLCFVSRHVIRVLLNRIFSYMCPVDLGVYPGASTVQEVTATATATSITTTTVQAVCQPQNTRFAQLLASTDDLDNMTVCFRSPEVGIFCSNAGKVFDWIEATYKTS